MKQAKLHLAALAVSTCTAAAQQPASAPTPPAPPIRTAESVNVTTGLPDSVALQKFTEPLLDTPQTVVAIPSFVLEEEGVSTLRDTLRNVPGISLAAGEAGAQGDNLTVRGFTARNDIFLDGIRDFGSYYRDAFNDEQVEVLEGPSGVQFGRGSTGGVVNQESKVPQLRKLLNVETQFGTDATRRISADLNQPLPELSLGAAFRLNLFGVEGGVAERDQAQVRRYGVAPSLSFGLNAKTRATLSYVHLNESDTPDYGLPWFFNRLAPGVHRSSYFGFADSNFLRTHDDIVTAHLDHDVSPAMNVHTIARFANYPRNAQITEPQICSNASVSVPVGGTVTALPASAINTALSCAYNPASDPASILVNRNQIQIQSVEGDLWDQTDITAHFRTLGLRHALTAGIEGGQEISNPRKTSYTFNKINSVPSANLLNPNERQNFGGTGYLASIAHAKSDSVGLYFVDTLHLSKLFELSGGVRWDRFDTVFNLYQPTPPAGATLTAAVRPSEQVVSQPTYRAAIVYKPSVHGSVYFDYGNSFNPSAETLSLSTSSAILPPEENETYEVGAKWSFLNDHLMSEGAIFRTTKDNARETDPTNSNNIVLAGNQLVEGAQVSLVARLPQGLDLVAGYAYLDSSVIYSRLYPTSIGYPLANVPKQTFNAFVTHRLPARFNAGFGSNYVASRQASSTVPYVPLTFSAPYQRYGQTRYTVLSTGMKQVPGYWVFNAMLNRPVTEKLNFQVNVNNLLNRFYIDQPHPSHLVPGEGLNALVGINLKF
jgi:catecholate siderophore receptor